MAAHVVQEPRGWGSHPHDIHDDYSDREFQTEVRAPKQGKNSNGKNKNDKNDIFEARYEGFVLEKAEPLVGEKPSWARVGRRSMPFDDAKLAAIARKHRALTGVGPAKAFAALSSSQQGVVDRLVDEYRANEKNKDAEWVLEYVKPTVEKDFWKRAIRCTKISVIIRRKQRAGTGKTTQGQGTRNYAADEIIDLANPLPKKNDKKGNKGNKGNKNNNPQDWLLDFDDNVGGGPIRDPFVELGRHPNNVDVPPNGPHHGVHHDGKHGGHHDGHHNNHQHHPVDQFGPPPGAIPAGPFPGPQIPHPHEQQHPQQGDHPFRPNHQFDMADLYDERRGHSPDRGRNGGFQARIPFHIEDERARSRSRDRSRSRLRKLERDAEERQDELRRQQRRAERETEEQLEEERRRNDEARRRDQRRMENNMDELRAELQGMKVQNKVEAWRPRDSSSEDSLRERRRERDFFWGEESTRDSFTPPSSPGRSIIYPSGSLGRGPSKERRDMRGYHSQERRRNGGGYPIGGPFVIEPYDSNSRRERDRVAPLRRAHTDYLPRAPSPPGIRHLRRLPPMIHASTASYDDYPDAQRRMLPQFEGQDYPRANFGIGRHGDGRRREEEYERERPSRRNPVDHDRLPRREDEQLFVERGGMRRDPIWRN